MQAMAENSWSLLFIVFGFRFVSVLFFFFRSSSFSYSVVDAVVVVRFFLSIISSHSLHRMWPEQLISMADARVYVCVCEMYFYNSAIHAQQPRVNDDVFMVVFWQFEYTMLPLHTHHTSLSLSRSLAYIYMIYIHDGCYCCCRLLFTFFSVLFLFAGIRVCVYEKFQRMHCIHEIAMLRSVCARLCVCVFNSVSVPFGALQTA